MKCAACGYPLELRSESERFTVLRCTTCGKQTTVAKEVPERAVDLSAEGDGAVVLEPPIGE